MRTRRLARVGVSLALCVLVGGLTAVSRAAGGNRGQASVPPSSFELIVDANVSPDGRFLAVSDSFESPGLGGTMTWFVDIDSREVIGTSDRLDGVYAWIPKWTGGSSYVMEQWDLRSGLSTFDLAESPREPRNRLDAVEGLPRNAQHLVASADGAWGVATVPTRRARWDPDVYLVRLAAPRTARKITVAARVHAVVGVAALDGSGAAPQALLVTTPVGGRTDELVAVDCGSGEVTVRVPLQIIGRHVVLELLLHAPGKALLAVETISSPSETQVLEVDFAGRSARTVCTVPEGYQFMTAIRDGGSTDVLVGGIRGVWEFTVLPNKRSAPRRIFTGRPSLHPAGVRVGEHGLEVFAYGEHGIWRWSAATGRVELFMGHPAAVNRP